MKLGRCLIAVVAALIATGCAEITPSPTPPTIDHAPVAQLQAIALANVPAIKLAWTAPQTGSAGCMVERATGNGAFALIAQLPPQASSYTDAPLSPDTLYSYRVRMATGLPSATPIASARTSPFRVFDSTYFTDKPNLKTMGVENIYVAAAEFFYLLDKPGGGYDMTKPNEPATRMVARRAADRRQILCIDIEHFPEDIRRDKPDDVQKTIDMYAQIVAWVRDERPEVKLGFYGSFPRREYWAAVNYLRALEHRGEPWWDQRFPEYEKHFKQWQAANDIFRPLAEKCDYIFPSIYTYYDTPKDWPYYAKANILESRRYNKPVIPFIWMEYHNSTPLKGQKIPANFWQLQLATCRQDADGLVIWGGVSYLTEPKGVKEPWSQHAAWWTPTAQFLTAD